jgi:hypothetical protein
MFQKFSTHSIKAFMINGAEDYAQRKWAEIQVFIQHVLVLFLLLTRVAQLANLGFRSYERINAKFIPVDDCVNSTGYNCQQGLTLAHLEVWRRIVALNQSISLIVEDDVTFHSNAGVLLPEYMAKLPRRWDIVYVGQLSRVVLDHDPTSIPLTTLLQSDVMPWCTHAYLIGLDAAIFLSNHVEYILSRSGSPHALERHFLNSQAGELSPWRMNALDMKIDFFLLSVHHYYFTKRSATWFTFESTLDVPARYASRSWSKNNEIELGNAAAGECAFGKPSYVSCEHGVSLTPSDSNFKCSNISLRLPLLGTGLAFQNKCKVNPFAIHAWTGDSAELIPPSCKVIRGKIRPTVSSEITPNSCLDEATSAMYDQKIAEFYQLSIGRAKEFSTSVKFSLAKSDSQLPWAEFIKCASFVECNAVITKSLPSCHELRRLTSTMLSAGNQPPVAITVHGLPCASVYGQCILDFWVRPGSTDAGVLGQVISSDEYGFLRKLKLPPPKTILDAGGA